MHVCLALCSVIGELGISSGASCFDTFYAVICVLFLKKNASGSLNMAATFGTCFSQKILGRRALLPQTTLKQHCNTIIESTLVLLDNNYICAGCYHGIVRGQ